MDFLVESLVEETTKERLKCVVKKTTNMWMNNNNEIVIKIQIRTLKRKSNLHIIDMIGEPDEILNLTEVKDGVYEIVPNNVSRDWETGLIEVDNFTLIEFKE